MAGWQNFKSVSVRQACLQKHGSELITALVNFAMPSLQISQNSFWVSGSVSLRLSTNSIYVMFKFSLNKQIYD